MREGYERERGVLLLNTMLQHLVTMVIYGTASQAAITSLIAESIVWWVARVVLPSVSLPLWMVEMVKKAGQEEGGGVG